MGTGHHRRPSRLALPSGDRVPSVLPLPLAADSHVEGITADANGDLYVTDFGAGRVIKVPTQ